MSHLVDLFISALVAISNRVFVAFIAIAVVVAVAIAITWLR